MKRAAQGEKRAGVGEPARAIEPWFAAFERIWDSFCGWRIERRMRRAARRYFKGLS